MFKKVIVIGASRGLGRAISQAIPARFKELTSLILVSRSRPNYELINPNSEYLKLDMSKPEDQDALCSRITSTKSDLVFYVAGGGPHGEFHRKDWKDHQWSLHVNLLAPMRAVHSWLAVRDRNLFGRFIVIGSHIAERSPDPLASSYAAGKHGIYGFVSSLQNELEGNLNKVWMASPGFLNTEMLPITAKVRHDGSKILETETVAQKILDWVANDHSPWHQVLN